MLLVFFDIRGIVIIDWVPNGQTVNQQYYLQVLQKLREKVRKKKALVVEKWMDLASGQ